MPDFIEVLCGGFALLADQAPEAHADDLLAMLFHALQHLSIQLQHIGTLDRALALDPADHSAKRNRALALLALGRADEASAIFAMLPAREPGEAAEYFDLGNAFARDGKYPEAAAAYTRTVTLEPTHFAARANLGNAFLAAGRATEAIAAYEAALRLRPADARLLENLEFARAAARGSR